MAFNTKSIPITELRTNAGILAHAAKGFNVPTVISTISKDSFAGPLFDEIMEAFPNAEITDRTTSNAWEDENFIARINASARIASLYAAFGLPSAATVPCCRR